jgi:2-dehydro-3-deoxy-D-gluconate 5-dehydrogenase
MGGDAAFAWGRCCARAIEASCGLWCVDRSEGRPIPANRDARQSLERTQAGRWGRPADLGGAAVFLAPAAADYVHGVVLPVDGGWLAR